MQAKASANMVRLAPRKARLVVDLIRGKQVGEALSVLAHTNKAASPMNIENLVVSEIFVNEGPTLKRFRPRAMGRASRINKRTSHIHIVVTEK